MKEIYTIKLISGIELIAYVEFEGDNLFNYVLTLNKPLRFGSAGTNSEGIPQVGFYSYLLSEPEPTNLILNGSTVESYLPESQIDSALLKEYQSNTSGIIL